MGLIIYDSVVIDETTSLSLSNIYINIGTVVVYRESNVYKLVYQYLTYFNQESRNNNKAYIQSKTNELTLNNMITDLYSYIYTDLKKNYSSYSDV